MWVVRDYLIRRRAKSKHSTSSDGRRLRRDSRLRRRTCRSCVLHPDADCGGAAPPLWRGHSVAQADLLDTSVYLCTSRGLACPFCTSFAFVYSPTCFDTTGRYSTGFTIVLVTHCVTVYRLLSAWIFWISLIERGDVRYYLIVRIITRNRGALDDVRNRACCETMEILLPARAPELIAISSPGTSR